ncbi:MAG: hypothetical protein PHI67_10870 [Candidatus Methanomethylophilaceae archaeon]|nr:hypothetical protein [Candidatus Methanomethylophilaceae archaeon]
MSYNAKVYMKQGGDELVVDGGKITVESGGIIDVAAGGMIKAAGTQAAHIADASGTVSVEAFNAVLKALEDVGILKSS